MTVRPVGEAFPASNGMAEIQNENLSRANTPPNAGAAAPIQNVPPPPPEVRIRTMKSDLESIRQSGGGAPQFRTIRAPSLVFERAEAAKKSVESKKKTGKLWLIVIPLVALVALGAAAYLAYGLFFGVKPTSAPQPAQLPSAQTPSAQTPLIQIPPPQTPPAQTSSTPTSSAQFPLVPPPPPAASSTPTTTQSR